MGIREASGYAALWRLGMLFNRLLVRVVSEARVEPARPSRVYLNGVS
jgi:hypothetical protein